MTENMLTKGNIHAATAHAWLVAFGSCEGVGAGLEEGLGCEGVGVGLEEGLGCEGVGDGGHVFDPAPHVFVFQSCSEQGKLQARLLQLQPPSFWGRPEATDKLLTVGTSAA